MLGHPSTCTAPCVCTEIKVRILFMCSYNLQNKQRLFPNQYQPVVIWKGDEVCFLWVRNCMFIISKYLRFTDLSVNFVFISWENPLITGCIHVLVSVDAISVVGLDFIHTAVWSKLNADSSRPHCANVNMNVQQGFGGSHLSSQVAVPCLLVRILYRMRW